MIRLKPIHVVVFFLAGCTIDASSADQVAERLASDAEFVARLRGEAGPQGPKGDPGPQGAAGRDAPAVEDLRQEITALQAKVAILESELQVVTSTPTNLLPQQNCARVSINESTITEDLGAILSRWLATERCVVASFEVSDITRSWSWSWNSEVLIAPYQRLSLLGSREHPEQIIINMDTHGVDQFGQSTIGRALVGEGAHLNLENLTINVRNANRPLTVGCARRTIFRCEGAWCHIGLHGTNPDMPLTINTGEDILNCANTMCLFDLGWVKVDGARGEAASPVQNPNPIRLEAGACHTGGFAFVRASGVELDNGATWLPPSTPGLFYSGHSAP